MNALAVRAWILCLTLVLTAFANAAAPNSAVALADEPKVADAKPGELRVIATAAMRGPLESVREQAGKEANGRPVFIEYGSARGNLKQEILSGQDFEVALLLPDINDELLKQGKILPQRYAIARIPVGIALWGDAANVDISTREALKTLLLNAKSVKYSPTGAAYDTVDKIFATLGIANEVKNANRQAGAAVSLAQGEYEIGIYPISEIIPNKAAKNLGPVPAELQVPVIIEAVVGAHANDGKAAMEFIRFLQGPAVDPGLRASGMIKDQSK